MNDFDVHFVYSGFLTLTASTEEEAREIGNEILHKQAQRIEHELYLNVVDPDEESYVTDVLEVY